MLARGSLGNPWLFEQLLGRRSGDPSAEDVLTELRWLTERAVEHLGEPRATGWLRKTYPWYVERLGIAGPAAKELNAALLRSESIEAALALIVDSGRLAVAA
jgi:tRNA-dihydrouridine synthase